MIENYLLIAFRNFLKNKTFTFINIAGLALSIAAVIVIILFAKNELTYDMHHTNASNLYMVYKERITPDGVQPTYDTWVPLKDELKNQYPEVLNAARMFQDNEVITIENERFDEDVYYADPEYFQLFDFPLAAGNNDEPFPDHSSVVISKAMASKLFGNQNVIGKVITVNYETDYQVSGIMEDYPANSFIGSEIVIPIQGHPDYKDVEKEWGSSFLFTYILLDLSASPGDLESKFPALIRNIWNDEVESRTKFRLLALKDHYDVFVGDSRDSYLLLYIALGIITIAGINFMNLSTARSMERAREIGMRKVIGAGYSQLVIQFLAEAVLLSFLGMGVAILMAELVIPLVNSSFSMSLFIPYSNPVALLLMTGFTLILGITSGIYPAFFLARFKILESLRGKILSGKTGIWIRNLLVTFQFAISLILIIATLVVSGQVQFMKNSNLAFDKDNLMVIPLRAGDFENTEEAIARIQTFKNEIAAHSGVSMVSASRHVPGRWSGSNLFVRPEGWEGDPLRMRYTYHDAAFFKTYGIKLIEGPGFLADENGDQRQSAVINEAAMDAFGWSDIKDKAIMIGNTKIEIVGLLKNFNYETLKQKVDPIIHFHRVSSNAVHSFITVRLNADSGNQVRDFIAAKWNLLDADRDFSYFYIDDEMKTLYAGEDRLLSVVEGFTLLSIVISSLGLFGLSSFLMNKKRREIGIRKVLGARISGLTLYFSGTFLKPILVAFLFAAPVCYYFLNSWLEEFAFKIDQSPVLYAGSLILLLAIAAITVAGKTIAAARTNPVNSLREE